MQYNCTSRKQTRIHNIANGYIHVWEDFLFRVDLLIYRQTFNIYSSERPTATNFRIATGYIHVCED